MRGSRRERKRVTQRRLSTGSVAGRCKKSPAGERRAAQLSIACSAPGQSIVICSAHRLAAASSARVPTYGRGGNYSGRVALLLISFVQKIRSLFFPSFSSSATAFKDFSADHFPFLQKISLLACRIIPYACPCAASFLLSFWLSHEFLLSIEATRLELLARREDQHASSSSLVASY